MKTLQSNEVAVDQAEIRDSAELSEGQLETVFGGANNNCAPVRLTNNGKKVVWVCAPN